MANAASRERTMTQTSPAGIHDIGGHLQRAGRLQLLVQRLNNQQLEPSVPLILRVQTACPPRLPKIMMLLQSGALEHNFDDGSSSAGSTWYQAWQSRRCGYSLAGRLAPAGGGGAVRDGGRHCRSREGVLKIYGAQGQQADYPVSDRISFMPSRLAFRKPGPSACSCR